MKKHTLLFSLFILFLLRTGTVAWAQQDSTRIQLVFPDQDSWSVLKEGQKLEFTLKATGGTGANYSFHLPESKIDSIGISFDSLGRFSWTPGYEFVNRIEGTKTVPLVFEVKNDKNEGAIREIELKVSHVNRAPTIGELKPFYVQYGVTNTYRIDAGVVKDEDNDPLVFQAITDQMPEGAKLSGQGEFTWKPSLTQFNQLKSKALLLEFFVEDQPNKARVKGKFKIDATQMDLPPQISVAPQVNAIRYKEDANVNLQFSLSDPNGDSDITSFSFVSENPGVPKSALIQNTPTQYEFIWKPSFDFVKDPLDSVSFTITFFVIDKTQKKEEKKIAVTILNAVNEAEKDLQLYTQYRTGLVRAWDLLEQLKDKEKELKRDFNRAKTGKKRRSVANASLGAVSGVAPIAIQKDPKSQKAVSVIGGTTVMTIGTLEATEVIGKSTKDLLERLNYVMEKKNELQTKGDIFARKYSLKSARRRPEFIKELDDFVALMNLKGLVALELDASWQNKQKASDNQISRTFKDFNPEGL